MTKKEWLIWLATVLFIVFASTVPIKLCWKYVGSKLCETLTIFEHIKYFLIRVF